MNTIYPSSSAMQRNLNMSYRKPVPMYIPTPPPSPRETDGPRNFLSIEKDIPPLPSEVEESFQTRPSEIPSNEFDSAPEGSISSNRVKGVEKDVPLLPRNSTVTEVSRDLSRELPPLPKEDANITDSSGRAEKDIPPLPDNWREVFAQNYHEEVLSKDLPKIFDERKSADDALMIKHRNQVGVPQPVITSESKLFLSLGPNSHGRGNSYVTLPGSQTSRGRGLPREYRPPTPPLRSRSNRPDFNHPVANLGNASHLDVRAPTGNYSAADNSSDRYHHNSARTIGSLTASPSFETERTAVSLAPSGMVWAHGMVAASDLGLHSNIGYPTVLLQKKARSASNVPDHRNATSKAGRSSFKKGFQSWARKVWRLLVVLK